MSTPIATNREPELLTPTGVLSPFRFSARGDGAELDRGQMEFHIGAGPVFWKGGHLPEDDTKSTFLLRTLTGLFPKYPAVRTIMPNQSLRIEKLMPTQEQEALYLCGAQESPADPQAPLMVEFTLSLAQADVTVDPMEFTGVLVGLKNNNTGVVVKFFTDGGTRRIELHDAQYTTISPPGPAYTANYDWDQGQPHTYKLLWHPKIDAVRLYVSSGQDNDTSDIVLIDGAVSDFPGPLPELERPSVQPVAYFGHGYDNPTGTSYWHEFYLHNKVSSPIIEGLFQGKHTGLIQTDEVVWYRPTELPRNHERPWPILPASFGDIAGVEELTSQNELWVTRGDVLKSFGFFRKEPDLKYGPSIFDFRVSGLLLDRTSGAGEATGMELYIDDGTRQARFALLDDGGTQSVGMLIGSTPAQGLSYTGDQVNWVNSAPYRLILDPTGNTPSRLIRMSPANEGVEETIIAQRAYSVLPASSFPGPSFGFLHNGNTIPAAARLKIGRLRYSTNLQYIEGDGASSVVWSLNDGSKGTSTVIDSETELVHTVGDTPFYLYHDEPKLTASQGFSLEFRGKVSGYEFNGAEDPIRRVSGVGVALDDGTYQYVLVFADMGPPTGRIVFLATDSDFDQNLFDIRSGKLTGTHVAVNWMERHIYRLEKSVGGVTVEDNPAPHSVFAAKFALYIDDDDEASLELTSRDFTPIPTDGVSRVRFGSLMTNRTTSSLWKYLRYSVSSGFDISAFPMLTAQQVSARFDNALNTIAEVWTS